MCYNWGMDQYSVFEIVSILLCKYIRDKTLLNCTTQQSLFPYVCTIAPTWWAVIECTEYTNTIKYYINLPLYRCSWTATKLLRGVLDESRCFQCTQQPLCDSNYLMCWYQNSFNISFISLFIVNLIWHWDSLTIHCVSPYTYHEYPV